MRGIGRGQETEQAVTAVTRCLESLNTHCLKGVAGGLEAMTRRDLTRTVTPTTRPVDLNPYDPARAARVAQVNMLVEQAQTAVAAYNGVQTRLRATLGDESSLDELIEGMDSLSGHCIDGLRGGLGAMAGGDFTVATEAVTRPIERAPGLEPGQLATTFNAMRAGMASAVDSYGQMRGQVGAMIAEVGQVAETVAAAGQQLSSGAQETGRAIEDVARSMAEMAAGAVLRLMASASTEDEEDEPRPPGMTRMRPVTVSPRSG